MALKTAAQFTKHFQTTKCFDKVLNKLKITSMGNGTAVAEMKIEEDHTNVLGGLHGGFTATLVDCISSYALLTDKNGEVPSVSVDLHTTYCKAAQLGDEILVNAKTIKAGKTLAFLEVVIQNKATGEVLVKGTHTKYLMRAK
ncbi:acyl-coenzyme A thioesterase 13 [Aethina tumida]|uniref:acyl-coenzyme A thioesterase 13 n=1 Tax=Aethina tumida TaxID=116153 RepID=UPI00096AEB18|nr:acyl-coenzyme A thioesterase 13 [Aethina tumida]